jgi:hypothetical protein
MGQSLSRRFGDGSVTIAESCYDPDLILRWLCDTSCDQFVFFTVQNGF